jgi:hypothetical protein
MADTKEPSRLDVSVSSGNEVALNLEPAVREDVAATSEEHESRQSYLQGPRLHLTTAA